MSKTSPGDVLERVENTLDKQRLNIDAYRTDEAVDTYSFYWLFPVEKYLFSKYYRPGDRLLDLACGAARTTLNLHEMGLSVKGIDISEKLIATAKRRFPYLDLEVGSYAQINAPDGSYDHVLISFNGLDYAYPEANRLTAIRECHRVLKKNGTFIFSSHNVKSLHASPYYFLTAGELFVKLKNTFRAFKQQSYIYENGFYTFFGSPNYVISQAEKHGFDPSEMVGFRTSRNYLFNKYCSPYIHYAFRKRD